MTSGLDPESAPELDEDTVRQWMVDYLVNTIGIDPEDIDCDAPLSDMAIGSADAVIMAGELAELLGRAVSPLEFWQYPTINALSCFVTGGDIEPVFDDPAPAAAPAGGSGPTVAGDRSHEPIAVIGMGCRFPGGIRGPDALWEFLTEGMSAVSQVPEDRWSVFDGGPAQGAAALAKTTRWGGFLDDVAGFDAEFFEIPPGEADKMDPQQRLLLEVTQEALENAGIPPQSLRHTQTGVFAGACLGEYGYLSSSDLAAVDAWSGTGGALSIIANRVSYFFDFRGPSLTVDTACSSSLVAVHLACQSLRSGDSDVALAAGVNVLLSPAPTRSFDAAEVLSPSGRCHAFDGRADGFVRSEGVGVVVLKRLSDARRDGDRVLAVVRGSAVNQDGKSNGLMAPNPASQMAVLRSAYANAGVDVREVDYVEAHGTGTLLGDPIEARALGTVLGKGRPADAPLLIGSVKTNLGHLESAAGVAGLMKAVLAVERGQIPPNLDYQIPNPHIPFDNLRLKVVAEQTDWADKGRPRRVGVSSFGFGGTNAHIVVEQAPEAPAHQTAAEGVQAQAVTTLVVSAKTPARIAALAGTVADWMDGKGADVTLAEVAHTLNHHRGRYALAATVCAPDRQRAVSGLRALAAGRSAPGVVAAHKGTCRAGTVFVYSGQGSQWPGMARTLLADEPAFAAAVDELEPVFVDEVGFSLRDVIAKGLPVSGDDHVQPAIMGLQLALTALWRSYGVSPDAVIGHSMGEVTAAVVSGALSPTDGLRVIATRSRLMAELGGRGTVGLVELDGEAAAEVIAGYPGVEIAGYLSPRQTVVAGPTEQVEALLADQSAADRFARRVNMELASHTALMDPVLPALREALADVTPRLPAIPFISTVTDAGRAVSLDAEYWAENVRRPVRFHQAVAAAAADYGTFIEVSPNPILTYAIDDILPDIHHHAIPTLARDTDDTWTFHTNLNATYTKQAPSTPHPPEPHAPLPTTPWHPTHHWAIRRMYPESVSSAPRPGTLLGGHTAIGGAVPCHLWQADILPNIKPYNGFRRIDGVEVVPDSVLLRTLSTAARECGAAAVEDVRFESPLLLDEARTVQVFTDGQRLTISSAPGTPPSTSESEAPQWIRHSSAQLSARVPDATDATGGGAESEFDLATPLEVYREWGIEGRAYEWSLDSHESTPGRLRVDVAVPASGSDALLAAAFDVGRLVGGTAPGRMLPVGVDNVSIPDTGFADGVGVIEVRRRSGDDLVVDVDIQTRDGATIADIRGLRYAEMPAGTELGIADPRTIVHVIGWQPMEFEPASDTETATLAVVGDIEAAQALRDRLSGLAYAPADLDAARYIVYIPNPGTATEAENDAAVRLTAEIGDLVARLAQRDYRTPATLWIVTRGVHDARSDAALRQSCVWGLAGVIGAEQPQLWGGLIDIDIDIADGGALADSAGALSEALRTPVKSTLLLRDGGFHTAVFAPLPGEPIREALRCRPDAAYLITGGLGELGLLMAGWLADRGARRLILAGRTPLPSRRHWDDALNDAESLDADTRDRIGAVRALEMRGVTVDTVSLDIGSAEALQALLTERADDGRPPVRGVVHAAGLTEGQLLTELDTARVARTMWPKVAGGQALNEVFPPGSVDFMFLIASAGAVFGVPGQAAYAAGNAHLDGLARARHRQGCNTVSLDWVAWQGLGFAKEAQVVVAELERMGSRPVNPAEAFLAWEHVSRYDVAQAVMAPMRSSEAALAATGSVRRTPARDWSQTPPEDLRAELQEGLRAILAAELHLPEDEIELDRPFAEMGLTSVIAMSIRRQAEELVGLELSATMLWNHPTIGSFSGYLVKLLLPDAFADDDDDQIATEAAASVLDSLFDSIESTSPQF